MKCMLKMVFVNNINNENIKLSPNKLDTCNTNESLNKESIGTSDPPPITDCWDSVTQQPFCTICQMAFKSIAFLERHNKYSDLHKSNVLKEENKKLSNNYKNLTIEKNNLNEYKTL